VRAAHDALKEGLYDPQSAQFRAEGVGDSGSVCGEVNAKNRLGGYVGFRRFVYVPQDKEELTLISDGPADFPKFLRALTIHEGVSAATNEIAASCKFALKWTTFCPSQRALLATEMRRCHMLETEAGVDQLRKELP
jgi:hypothetical protein